MACGGKKRIKKGLLGMAAPSDNGGKRNVRDPRLLTVPYEVPPMQVSSQLPTLPKSTILDTYSSRAAQRRRKLGEAYDRGLIDANKLNESLNASDSLQELEVQDYNNFPSLEEIRMIQDPIERKRMEEEFWRRHNQRYLLYKRGGKTLTKAKANSLKYKGGPGDINSTEGMKPNKKQRRMLCKRIGGMVNNAKRIDIYQLPGMIDYIKY